jgi:menaquinone-9 beta-reductase
MSSCDALVVGGGPSGLAAAIALRLRGLRVLLAEARTPPVDKACGEGIMPEGVEHLIRLGVVIDPAASCSFRGIRYVDGPVQATARFRGASGLGVRRTVLHDALRTRATDLGVELRWGAFVEGLRPDGAIVDGRVIRARWIIGADGRGSRVRRWQGLDSTPRSRRIGSRRHYEITPWNDLVEVHWSPAGEIYVTPVADRQVCIAAICRDPKLGLDGMLDRFPALRARLAGAPVSASDRGAGTDFRTAGTVVRGSVALLGDAAGSVDAISGQGVTLGLEQAAALARALAAADLRRYAADYRRIMALPNAMTALMLALSRHSRVRRVAFETLARVPALFRALLGLHAGAAPRLAAS